MLKYQNPAGSPGGVFYCHGVAASALALVYFSRYTSLMSKTGAIIVEQVSRGHVAIAERSRAFTSLLLLGLTRGCRVL